ncbi:3528_t:CDS:2, partial [Funneliformis caledonium]
MSVSTDDETNIIVQFYDIRGEPKRNKRIEETNFHIENVKNIADAVGPYLPFVSIVSAAKIAIKALMRQSEDNLENFCKQSYYDSFQRFVNCLKQIKKFCVEISNLSKFKRFFTSGDIKDKFESVIGEFNECSDILNLEISIATKEQMDKDFTILQNNIVAMKKFLDDIEGGVTSIKNKEIDIIIKNIQQQNDKILEQNKQLLGFKDRHISLSFGSLNEEIDSISSFSKQVNGQNSLQ